MSQIGGREASLCGLRKHEILLGRLLSKEGRCTALRLDGHGICDQLVALHPEGQSSRNTGYESLQVNYPHLRMQSNAATDADEEDPCQICLRACLCPTSSQKSFSSSTLLMIASCIVSLFSLILLCCAMAANTSNKQTIRSLGWGTIHQTATSGSDLSAQWYMGLFGYYYDITYYSDDDYISGYQSYADCEVEFNACDGCSVTGQAAFSLAVITAFFTFTTLILSLIRIFADHILLRVSSIIMNIISVSFLLGSVAGFYATCLKNFAEDANSAAKAVATGIHTWELLNAGAIVAIISIFFSIILIILHAVTPTKSNQSTNTTQGTTPIEVQSEGSVNMQLKTSLIDPKL